MRPSSTRLSYKDRRSHQRKRSRIVTLALIVMASVLVLNHFVLETWVLQTQALEPGYPPRTRLLVSHYILAGTESTLLRRPRRGDLVMIRTPYVVQASFPKGLLDPLLRFLSFQKLSLLLRSGSQWEGPFMFKRVIALPGDTVRMENSVAYVRTQGTGFFLSEFEVSSSAYDIAVPDIPEGWDRNLPLSGWMDEQTLSDGEYFVLGDNRSASNDSRYWGPVASNRIHGRVLLSYWPPRNFGTTR